MTSPKLFTPIKAGAIDLKNRIVMAPLTRNRARAEDDAPYDIHVDYYAQRAGAGLIVTEASQISPEGKGYAWTPGIYSPAQVAGWKAVTDAVHAKGGRIVLQMWHVGRISHTVLQPDGQVPVAPSAIGAKAKTFDGESFVETSEPRALELSEIPRVIEDYRKAARNAVEAGFDGVEIHAANGYLIDQFLRDGANRRTDAYGGSIENRTRFMREVVEAVTEVWGADRVGIRLSPFSNANNISDSDPMPLFEHAVDILNGFGLAYLHMVEGQTGGPRELAEGQSIEAPAGPVRWRLHGQQRLQPGPGDRDGGERQGRSRCLRPALHRQPGSRRAAGEERAAERAGQRDLLWRRPGGLYRLPVPRRDESRLTSLTVRASFPPARPGGRDPSSIPVPVEPGPAAPRAAVCLAPSRGGRGSKESEVAVP